MTEWTELGSGRYIMYLMLEWDGYCRLFNLGTSIVVFLIHTHIVHAFVVYTKQYDLITFTTIVALGTHFFNKETD